MGEKLVLFPFPFPYSQLLMGLLLMHYCMTPVLAWVFVTHPVGAAAVSFIPIFAFWSINYIAAEIEMPFGDDPNDLPMALMQDKFNECATLLLHPMVDKPPVYVMEVGNEKLRVQKSRISSRFIQSQVNR